MDTQALLIAFFEKASGDARIGIAHIGLYMGLLQCWIKEGCQYPMIMYGSAIMKVAKISSSATYHRLIRDLAAFGYLKYEPSFYKGRGSRFYL